MPHTAAAPSEPKVSKRRSLAPNSMELWRRYRPAIGVGAYLESMKSNWSCRLNFRTAAFTAALLVISCMRLMEVSPFLYFEF